MRADCLVSAAPLHGATRPIAMQLTIGLSACQNAVQEDDGHHNYFCSSSLCHRRVRHHYRRQCQGGDRPLQPSDRGWPTKQREQGASSTVVRAAIPRPSPHTGSHPRADRPPARAGHDTVRQGLLHRGSLLAYDTSRALCRPGRRMVSLGKVMAPKPVNLPSQKCVDQGTHCLRHLATHALASWAARCCSAAGRTVCITSGTRACTRLTDVADGLQA